PAWVRVVDGRFELVEPAAAAVRRIFRLAREGLGITAIKRRLVEEKVPPFGTSGEWCRASVAAIVRSRRVVGEYQPRKGSTMKTARPDGPPIANYFPAVISEEEWAAARAVVREHRMKRGPDGKTVHLFGGLLRDARDGQP